MDRPSGWVAILDFGSQYTRLVARRVRQRQIYCEILPSTTPWSELREAGVGAVILSGGPASTTDPNAPTGDPAILEGDVPILGICYGMQWMIRQLGGNIASEPTHEYGPAQVRRVATHPKFDDMPEAFQVWMSHGDSVTAIPREFTEIARTAHHPAVVVHQSKPWLAVQFHPEVTHTDYGDTLFDRFLGLAKLSREWQPAAILDQIEADVRGRVGDKTVVCAVSGGVDSTVMAAVLNQSLGKRAHCIFIDTGLLRRGEREEVAQHFATDVPLENFEIVDAQATFLAALEGVVDPEAKRKIIGRVFVEVFLKAAGEFDFLAQGTLYPDIIESAGQASSSGGHGAATIKTHHNRVQEIRDLMEENRVIEPFADLFKDEVRNIGRELGLPARVIERHPFPGPGLAVRILGEITPERLTSLRQADAIFQEALHRHGLYREIGQAFAVLIPLNTVGVTGDNRAYGAIIGLRAVSTTDYMTADWSRLPDAFLAEVSNRILNDVRGVNRVVYDISTKPPATIEWE